MTFYPTAEETFAEAEGKLDLANAIFARSTPLLEGDAGWLY